MGRSITLLACTATLVLTQVVVPSEASATTVPVSIDVASEPCMATLPEGTPIEVATAVTAGIDCDWGMISASLGLSAACLTAAAGAYVTLLTGIGALAAYFLIKGVQLICGGAFFTIVAAIASCFEEQEQDADLAAVLMGKRLRLAEPDVTLAGG